MVELLSRIPAERAAAAALKRWRSNSGLSGIAAAGRLGISPRMLAYYESGTHPVPRTVDLAVEALNAGLSPAADRIRPDARLRWVALVDSMQAYGRGAPVVGQMLLARDRDGLADFLAFIRHGPDPRLALTDPALFKTLRLACTRAQLAGLGTSTLNERQWARLRDPAEAARLETIVERRAGAPSHPAE